MPELLLPFADPVGEGWYDPPPEGWNEPTPEDDEATGGDDPSAITLYPYQEACVAKALAQIEAGVPSGLIVLPTGTGKTIAFGSLAVRLQRAGKRVLILAHTGELIDQTVRKVERLGGEATIEKAALRALRTSLTGVPPIVVGSVQTLRGKRLLSWPAGYFDAVIVDECHHRPARTYCQILDWLSPRYELGVTATPTRADAKNLGRYYPRERLVYELKLTEAIDQGYLVPLDIRKIQTDIDLRFVRNTAGDLNQGDLEDAIRPHVQQICRLLKAEVGGLRGVIFTPDVATADAVASGLSSSGIGLRAESVAGDSSDRLEILGGIDPKTGRRVVGRYETGETQVVANCALLTEGWDAPWTEFIAVLRPTKSLGLLTQMVGRGTRTSPRTGKTKCVVVDFTYKVGKHTLVTPLDLVTEGNLPDAVRRIAEMLIADGRQTDPQKALRQAQEEAQRRARAEAERKARAEAERLEKQQRRLDEQDRLRRERSKLQVNVTDGPVKYRKASIDLGRASDALGMEIPDDPFARLDPPSPKMVNALVQFGMDQAGAEALSFAQAQRLLKGLFKRRELGLATLKQLNLLLDKGVPDGEARRLTIREASDRIDALKGKVRPST